MGAFGQIENTSAIRRGNREVKMKIVFFRSLACLDVAVVGGAPIAEDRNCVMIWFRPRENKVEGDSRRLLSPQKRMEGQDQTEQY